MSGDEKATGPCGCSEAKEQLWQFLDAELGAEQTERIRLHLEQCPGCEAERELDVALKLIVRRGCQEQAPSALRLRVHQSIAALRIAAAAERG